MKLYCEEQYLPKEILKAQKCTKDGFTKFLKDLFLNSNSEFDETAYSYKRMFECCTDLMMDTLNAGLLDLDIIGIDPRDTFMRGIKTTGIQELGDTCYIGLVLSNYTDSVYVAVYFANDTLRLYIPTCGNTADTKNGNIFVEDAEFDEEWLQKDLQSAFVIQTGNEMNNEYHKGLIEKGRELRATLKDKNGELIFKKEHEEDLESDQSDKAETGIQGEQSDSEDMSKDVFKRIIGSMVFNRQYWTLNVDWKCVPEEASARYSQNAHPHLLKAISNIDGQITKESVQAVLNDENVAPVLKAHGLTGCDFRFEAIDSDPEDNLLGLHNTLELTTFGLIFEPKESLPVFVFLHFTTMGWRAVVPTAGNFINRYTEQPLKIGEELYNYIKETLFDPEDEENRKKYEDAVELRQKLIDAGVPEDELDEMKPFIPLSEQFKCYEDIAEFDLPFVIDYTWIMQDISSRFGLI